MDLKNCPFCDMRAEDCNDGADITCKECITSEGCLVSHSLWNTRPIEKSLQSRIKELEEALELALSYESCMQKKDREAVAKALKGGKK